MNTPERAALLPIVQVPGKGLVVDQLISTTKRRDDLLEDAAMIVSVETKQADESVVSWMAQTKEFLNRLEEDRKFVKAPFLSICQKLDETHRTFADSLRKRLLQVGALHEEYVRNEYMRQQAAINAENERLSALTRAREAEIAKAPNLETVDNIRDKYSEQARVESTAIVAPELPENVKPKEVFRCEITDPRAFCSAHPQAILSVEPNLAVLEQLFRGKIPIQGAVCKIDIVAPVRAARRART